MKKSNLPDQYQRARKLLRTHRKTIDNIDDKIMKLLGQRFDTVRKVARIKFKNNIDGFLGDRVHEVRERNVKAAKKYGIDQAFLRSLYTLLIYESCSTEDLLKRRFRHQKKKS